MLSDGTNTYIYGNGRIAQTNSGTEYFLGDALGSVRQLTNDSGAVTYASAYDPYGVTAQTYGASQTAYGYTGEYTSNELVYLRARHYAPGMGRFLTRDTWGGDASSPMSFNKWNYVEGNPINFTDPTGFIKQDEADDADEIVKKLKVYRVFVKVDWGNQLWVNSPIDLNKMAASCRWYEGEWELNELKEMKKGVMDLARAMGYNNFLFNIGYVDIVKADIGNDVANTVLHRIQVSNAKNRTRISHWSTVHELAHAWDANTNGTTSVDFFIATAYNGKVHPSVTTCDPDRKLPGCNTAGYVYVDVLAYGLKFDNFNIQEDFANSVMVYVYPDLQKRLKKYDTPQYGAYLYYTDYRTTLRWSIVDALIRSTNKYRPR